MRPLSFAPQVLRKHLLRHKIATLPELKAALGTSADLTVFRKLKLLDYLSSYTHRGRYYALRETARFDDVGLWSHDAVWFSRYGTLVATIEALVNQAPRRLFAGLESIKLGHGGDSILAEFLGVDPHTIARGRQQLLDENVSTGRTRRSGGGRKRIEKKPPTSSH